MPEAVVVVLIICAIPLAVLSIPIIALLQYNKRKMMELNHQAVMNTNDQVLRELLDLRRQITELRDTTTQYDVGFDTALNRMDERMRSMEQRMLNYEADNRNTQYNRP